MGSVVNGICYEHVYHECALLWTCLLLTTLQGRWSVMNMVCCEGRSVFNGSDVNVLCDELVWGVVCYEGWSVIKGGLSWRVVCHEGWSVMKGGLSWRVVCYERGPLWTWSVMNAACYVVCFQRGLFWKWFVLNVVCYERGPFWTWSVMNVVCNECGVMNVVCYECGLL